MHPVVFTQAARHEVIEAQDWYEGEVSGLGQRFRQELDDTVQRMSQSPQQFPVVFKKVRRALLRRFPYSVFFVVEDGGAVLVSPVSMQTAIPSTGDGGYSPNRF